MFDLVLVIIAVLILFISSLIDIKEREIPDKLSLGLINLAIILKIFHAYEIGDFSILVYSLVGFLIFLGVSLLMYYTRQWGGGDAKLFMGLGIAFPRYPDELIYFTPNLNLNFMLIIGINVLIFGFIFGMGYMVYLLLKNKDKMKKLKIKVSKLHFVLPVILIFLSLHFQHELRILLLVSAFLVIACPYLFGIIKFVEREIMTYKLKVNELTEGDWVLHNVYHKKEKLYSYKSPGVTLKQIELFKQFGIKAVTVREGIPFVPAIFLAVVFSLMFGNLIAF